MVYELRYGDHLLKFLSVYALLEKKKRKKELKN